MSKAFKCDRCQKCFDPYAVDPESYFTTIKEVCCQDGAAFQCNKVSYRDEGLHLCPDCSEVFFAFMDDMKKTEEEPANEALQEIQEITEETVQQAKQISDLMRNIAHSFLHGAAASHFGKNGGTDSNAADGQSKTPERKKRAQKNRQ